MADIEGPPNVSFSTDIDAGFGDGEIRIGRLDANLGDASLGASGTVNLKDGADRSELQATLSVPDFSLVNALIGADLSTEKMTASFTALSEDSTLTVSDLALQHGSNIVAGQLVYRSGDTPSYDIDLHSDLLDLRPFLDVEPAADEPETAAQPTPELLIPDDALPFSLLDGFDASVDIGIDAIQTHRDTYTDLNLTSRVHDSALEVTDFRFTGNLGGLVSGRMGIEPHAARGHQVWLRLNGQNIDIGMPTDTLEERAALPRYDISAAFISAGSTVRELAGSANGYFKLVSGAGRIKAGLLSMFSDDFLLNLIQTINPVAKTDPYTNLECSAILATVEDGQLVGNPIFVLQSAKVKIVASAKVNLKTEKLDADFNTVARKGLGISLGDMINPYVRVTGSLAAPSLTFDKTSAVFEGGAAVATAGLSILALNFKNRFLTDGDPCGKAIEDASQAFAELELKYGNAEEAEKILRAGQRK